MAPFSDFPPPSSGPALVRPVAWNRLPLGAIILEAPRIYGGSLPELMGFPVLTRSLREQLWSKYQLGPQAQALILDPDAGVEPTSLVLQDRQIRRLMTVLPELGQLKEAFRLRWKDEPDLKTGFSDQIRADQGPYTLRKNWMRSFKSLAEDRGGFADQAWGTRLTGESPGTLLGRLLSQEIRLEPRGTSLVDVGLDVSFSMESSGKAALVLTLLDQLMPLVAARLGTSTWRVWLVSDRAVPYRFAPRPSLVEPELSKVLKTHSLTPGDTHFGPFFRQVLQGEGDWAHHLCLLITDGACQDKDKSLRWLEKLGTAQVDYLQLVLHHQEDFRQAIRTPYTDRSRDGVLTSTDLQAGEEPITRTDSEVSELSQHHLRDITDLAEAARGGQIHVAWNPVTGALLLDVYEQYLQHHLLN